MDNLAKLKALTDGVRPCLRCGTAIFFLECVRNYKGKPTALEAINFNVHHCRKHELSEFEEIAILKVIQYVAAVNDLLPTAQLRLVREDKITPATCQANTGSNTTSQNFGDTHGQGAASRVVPEVGTLSCSKKIVEGPI